MKRKNKMYHGTYGWFLGFKASLNIWLRWAKERFMEGRMVYFCDSSHRHRRSMRYTDMMALIGDNNNYRFTRRAITIGRCKHGKFHYMPKRVRLEQIE